MQKIWQNTGTALWLLFPLITAMGGAAFAGDAEVGFILTTLGYVAWGFLVSAFEILGLIYAQRPPFASLPPEQRQTWSLVMKAFLWSYIPVCAMIGFGALWTQSFEPVPIAVGLHVSGIPLTYFLFRVFRSEGGRTVAPSAAALKSIRTLAKASIALAVCSPLTGGLTILPGLIIGIVALVRGRGASWQESARGHGLVGVALSFLLVLLVVYLIMNPPQSFPDHALSLERRF